jgi:protocatechuate 3,4-dioxygenase beta subunit
MRDVAFEDSGPNSTRPEVAPVLTDSQGRFAFQVEEGGYVVRVQANGYVPQAYGQRVPEGQGTPVVLSAGQTTRNINISLTPAANLSGRIRDEAGRPLANVPVQLLQYSYDEKAEPSYRTGVVGAVQTNDRGEYRMYWVTPGRYYVLAGRSTTGSNPMRDVMAMVLGGANAAGSKVSPVAGHAFYPGVADISNARAVDLQPGAELQAVDVTLTAKPRTYSVRGKLVDAGTGLPPSQANVSIIPQTPGLTVEGIEAAMGMSNRNYEGATGKFEIRGLLPGPYVVVGIAEDPLATTRRGPPIKPSGMVAVSVTDKDVDDVVVSVAPAASITGRLRIEGQLPPSLTMDQLHVGLHPTGPNRAAQQTMQIQLAVSSGPSGFYEASQIRADGTFRIDNVVPGEYRLEVNQALSGRDGIGFVREARFEGVDILNNLLRFTGSSRGEMDIVLVVGGGKLAGSVTDARSQPLSGVRVVIVPDRSRSRVDLYRTVITDENGRFLVSAVPPGDYKLFSWESIQEFAWFDAEVMARFESRGRSVHVTENSNETIDLRIIPADGAR